ncbi:guanylate cyclase, putative, partial [Bodo saltans]
VISSAEGHELHVNLHHVFEWVSCVAKYVPKEVVSDIMRSGQRGGGGGGLSKGNNASTQAPHMTQRTVTLLFCDIENFTTFCEHVPPEDMVDLLEIYFAKMTSVLLQHGCTIDKYIGDAIMGFWGAPLEYHCQGFSACCAALHMQYAVAKLRPYFMRFQHHLNVRVGIHRGVAAVGNIGCSVRLSYTALGDVVNTAARLEGLNKHFGTRVCVSQSVVNDIDGGHFAFRALGSVRVKGKLDALSVYELIGVRTSPPSSSSPKDSGMKHGIKPNSMMLDTRSEAVYTHQTGLSTATDKFAELNVESELLTAKRFKAISERQVEVLAKIESAIQSYQRGDIRDGIVALEQVLHDHSRTLIKLDIDVGKLADVYL